VKAHRSAYLDDNDTIKLTLVATALRSKFGLTVSFPKLTTVHAYGLVEV